MLHTLTLHYQPIIAAQQTAPYRLSRTTLKQRAEREEIMLANDYGIVDPMVMRRDPGFPLRSNAHMATHADALTDTLPEGKLRVVAAKEHVYCEGDTATHVYRVEAGHICIYRMLPDGRRQVLSFAAPGDFIGLGALGSHPTSAQASSRTRLRCFSLTQLHNSARRDARLGLKLYEAVAEELVSARDLLMTVCHRTASERLAAFLIALSRRNHRRGENAAELVLPMTRVDIADLLGLTIETVSRTFTKFRLDGLIDLEQCILVTIRDAAALETAAGGGMPPVTQIKQAS